MHKSSEYKEKAMNLVDRTFVEGKLEGEVKIMQVNFNKYFGAWQLK